MTAEQYHLEDLPPDEGQAPRGRLTVEELRRYREEIIEVGRRYGISNVRVFGSVARGEADEHSDLDLLIDVAPDCGYFEMAGFALDIERLVGVFTQVATPNGLKKRLKSRVLAEAIPL